MPKNEPENQEKPLQTQSQTAVAASSAPEFQLFFEENYQRVFRAAYRVTGNAQDAEDVLQTVFLRLLRRWGELGLGPSPSSYLHRSAVNGALDILRARARARSVPLDEFGAGVFSDEPGPERLQQSRELRRSVREAVLGLSSKAAEMFVLRYFEGLGNKEIAEVLGTSQTAVGVALHRARKSVRNDLQGLVGGQ